MATKSAYHDRLAALIAAERERAGIAFHLSCHCMGTIGPVTAHDHGQRRNDFCLSDRDGTTSSREFMDVIAGAMRALSSSVSYNDPFKRADSVRLHGNPAGGVHSVQIEVIPGRHGSERVTADAPSGIGAPLRRREDLRFLTGRGRYVADLRGTGKLWACFVRSPHAHARLRGIDLAPALAMPGVAAAFAGSTLHAAGVGSIPSGWKLTGQDGRPMAEPPHHPLVLDKARHVGDPVAVVLAETLHAARDAAEQVAVDWEVLPAVASTAEAVRPGASLVWADVPDNLCCDWALGDAAAVNVAFAAAAHGTRLQLVNNRLAPVPMEPRAAGRA